MSRKKTARAGVRPRSRRKKLGRNLLLLLGALLSVLLLGEAVARVGYYLHDRKTRAGMRILWSWAYASIAEPSGSVVQEKPEYRITLRSNREGFRDLEPRFLGERGIAILGDSYTWGTGVEANERFSNILAESLGRDIANYGLCTSGTINELAVYEDFVRARRPGLVLLVFYPNDLENNSWYLGALGPENVGSRHAVKAFLENLRRAPVTWPDEKNLLLPAAGCSAFGHFVLGRIKALSAPPPDSIEIRLPSGETAKVDKNFLIGNSNWAGALTHYTQPLRLLWGMTETILGLLRDRVRENGGKLLLVYLPYQEAIQPEDWAPRKKRFRLAIPDELMDFERPRRELADVAGKLGIEMLDLTEGLKAAFALSTEPLYYLYDAHLTRRGNRVVAGIISGHLKPSPSSQDAARP